MANDMIGLHINLSNMAASQWLEFNFKSVCELNGVCIGGNSDGLFSLGATDTDQYVDADDPGTNIDAYFEPVTTDLGIPNKKRLRALYIGHESDGELQAVVKFDEETTGHTFSFSPEGTENRQRSAELYGRRDQKGRYFSVKIQNVDGFDFSVDTIDAIPVILHRKPSGS